MFVKSVLRDSFKELKVALKNPKLVIVSLIMMFVNVFVGFKFYFVTRQLLILVFLSIVNVLFIVFQYSSLGKIIHSKEKKIVKNKNLSYGERLVKFIKVILVLALIIIGIVISLFFIFSVIYSIISSGVGGDGLFSIIARFSKIISIVVTTVFTTRVLLCIPLSILDNTYRPIHLSLEITKGYFWRLTVVEILIPLIFTGINTIIASFLLAFVNTNLMIVSIITLPINLIVTTLSTIIIINSMYYLMNKELLDVRKIKSEVESV